MTKAEELFHEIASGLSDTKEGKMFGALCIKASNGKALAMFHKENMVFKLEEAQLAKALRLKGAAMFDPMGGRPMNGWVQLSYEQSGVWKELEEEALAYVNTIMK